MLESASLLPETMDVLRPIMVVILLVHVPLALQRLGVTRRAWISCGLAAIGVYAPMRELGVVLIAPWLAHAAYLALTTLRGLVRDPRQVLSPSELAGAAAKLLAPVGPVWLLFSTWGWAPLGFQEPIVFLTAVHFHVAGFVGLVIVSEVGKLLGTAAARRGPYRLASLGAVLGMPLVALGIVVTGVVEVVGVVIFTSAMTLFAVILFIAAPRICRRPWAGQVAAVSLLIAMVLALIYQLGPHLGSIWLMVPEMAATHGVLNVFGYTLPALLALTPRDAMP